MEEESSDLDVEEMAMITCKFKKFFKKTKENSKRKKTSASSRTVTGNSFQGVSNVTSLTTL